MELVISGYIFQKSSRIKFNPYPANVENMVSF